MLRAILGEALAGLHMGRGVVYRRGFAPALTHNTGKPTVTGLFEGRGKKFFAKICQTPKIAFETAASPPGGLEEQDALARATERMASAVWGGRQITPAELEAARQTVRLCSGLSRLELARTICEHWEWVTASGSHQVTACLKVLEHQPLHRNNVPARCHLGARHRWGIETGFPVEKHHGYPAVLILTQDTVRSTQVVPASAGFHGATG